MAVAMQKQYCGFKSLAAHLYLVPIPVNSKQWSSSAYKINFLDICRCQRKMMLQGLSVHIHPIYVNSGLLNINSHLKQHRILHLVENLLMALIPFQVVPQRCHNKH